MLYHTIRIIYASLGFEIIIFAEVMTYYKFLLSDLHINLGLCVTRQSER